MPVVRHNSRALTSKLSLLNVINQSIAISNHLHQRKNEILCAEVDANGIISNTTTLHFRPRLK